MSKITLSDVAGLAQHCRSSLKTKLSTTVVLAVTASAEKPIVRSPSSSVKQGAGDDRHAQLNYVVSTARPSDCLGATTVSAL